jgi:hypothetical protein
LWFANAARRARTDPDRQRQRDPRPQTTQRTRGRRCGCGTRRVGRRDGGRRCLPTRGAYPTTPTAAGSLCSVAAES